MAELQNSLKFYAEYFSWIDWVSYSWAFLLFLIIFVVSIYVMSKAQILGVLMLFLSIFGLAAGVYFISDFLDTRLRARNLELISQKRLSYTDALVVDFNLKNLSKKSFGRCNIRLKFYYPSENKLKNAINKFKPFLKENIIFEGQIAAGESRRISGAIEGFRAARDYNITTASECF